MYPNPQAKHTYTHTYLQAPGLPSSHTFAPYSNISRLFSTPTLFFPRFLLFMYAKGLHIHLPSPSCPLLSLLLHFKKTSGSHSVENQNNMWERQSERDRERQGNEQRKKNLLVKIKQYEKCQHIKTCLDLCLSACKQQYFLNDKDQETDRQVQ